MGNKNSLEVNRDRAIDGIFNLTCNLQPNGCLMDTKFEMGNAVTNQGKFKIHVSIQHVENQAKKKGFKVFVKPMTPIKNFGVLINIKKWDSCPILDIKIPDVKKTFGDGSLQEGVERFVKKKLRDEDITKMFKIAVEFRVSAFSEVFTPSSLTLYQTIGNLYGNPSMSDFEIICAGKSIPCHKFVLSTRSDVFRTMFVNSLNETNSGQLEIKDLKFETLEAMMKFLYTDQISLAKINSDLLIAAEKYNIQRLYEQCVHQLKRTLTVENVLEVMITAFLVNSEELLKAASAFALIHRGKILKGENWEHIKITYPQIASRVLDEIIFVPGN